MKDKYYLGSDLDLSKIIVYSILSDDSQGERINVTTDMITGYNKDILGEQEKHALPNYVGIYYTENCFWRK